MQMMLTRGGMLSLLADIIARNNAVPREAVTETARLDDDLGLDMWDIVTLELDAEEALRVELNVDVDDIPPTIGGLIDAFIGAGFQVLPDPPMATEDAA